MTEHKIIAERLFKEGCNCSQAVFVAFAKEIGLEKELALRLSSSFGGGIGRLREVCGALGIRESNRHGFKTPSFRRYFVKKPRNATALLRFFPCNNKNLAS